MKPRYLLQTWLMSTALLWSGHVSAHATPTEYDPASSSILTTIPQTVTIRFSERVEPRASSITVYAPDGSVASQGQDTVDATDAHLFSIPITDEGSGSYTVSWQVVSADDGHFSKGGYVFSVGTESAGIGQASEGQFQVQHQSDWPEAIVIWMELLGEAILLGCLTIAVTVWRKTKEPTNGTTAEKTVMGKMRLLVWLALLLLLCGGIGYLLLESANLAFDQSTSFGEAFRTFLTTVAGESTMERLVTSVLFVIVFVSSIQNTLRASSLRTREIFLFLLLASIALLRARVSHAAASSFLPTLSIVINAVHLFAKDMWIGGLVAFIVTLLPVLEKRKDTKALSLAFLCLADVVLFAFVVGGVTGTYIIWLHLKSVANLLTTHWGGYLLNLSLYAIIFLLLRFFQQQTVATALVRHCENTADETDRETIGNAGMFLLLEMFVGIAILLFSSILIITTPPLSPQRYVDQTVTSAAGTVEFGEDPYEDDQFRVIATPTGLPQSGTGEHMIVTMEKIDKGIGPIVPVLQERFPGGYVFPKTALSPPGRWTVHVTDQQQNAYDIVGSFTIDYPEDVTVAHAHDERRGFGTFEITMIVTAAIIMLLAYAFHRKNKSLRERCLRAATPAALPRITVRRLFPAIVFDVIAVVLIGLTLGSHNHGSAAMQQACTLNGGVWHENVPMRDGIVTSNTPVIGCMLGAGRGQFHFADPREFAYFTRRTQAYASLQTPASSIVANEPTTLYFRIEDENHDPITDLTLEHDRILHVVIVSGDLHSFAHVHPEDGGPITDQMLSTATFPVQYTFPHDGTYLIGIDFTVRAQTFTQQFTVQVGDGNGPALPVLSDAFDQTFDNMQVHLQLPSAHMKANTVQKLTYTFTDDGTPVTDLEPYLSAAMHLSIVKTDMRRFVHVHAELPQSLWDSIFSPRNPNAKHVHVFLPDRFGSVLVAYVLFPLPGDYELYGEVNRDGRVTVTTFHVTVE